MAMNTFNHVGRSSLLLHLMTSVVDEFEIRDATAMNRNVTEANTITSHITPLFDNKILRAPRVPNLHLYILSTMHIRLSASLSDTDGHWPLAHTNCSSVRIESTD